MRFKEKSPFLSARREKQKRLSVILPSYNEAENLPVILPRIKQALALASVPYEILVVDDNSPDGSADVAEEVARIQRIPLHVLRRTQKSSLASAVVDGARIAHCECVAVMDADLSHDPAALPMLAAPVLAGEVDIAIGSRYIKDGVSDEWSSCRRVLSKLGTLCARCLTAANDPLSGYFVSRRGLLDKTSVYFTPRGYKILLEVLCRLESQVIVREIPITFVNRINGSSKLGIRQQIEFLVQLVCLALVKYRHQWLVWGSPRVVSKVRRSLN